MSQIELRKLGPIDQAAYERALKEFRRSHEFEYLPPQIIEKNSDLGDVLSLLAAWENGQNLPAGWVPGTYLFGFNSEGEIVGRVAIRHVLTDYLLRIGGHIGYGILPAFRRRGFATQMLKESLTYCRERLQLTRVLLTCDDDNVGSIKTIESNCGKLENVLNAPSLKVAKRRYWIDLSNLERVD